MTRLSLRRSDLTFSRWVFLRSLFSASNNRTAAAFSFLSAADDLKHDTSVANDGCCSNPVKRVRPVSCHVNHARLMSTSASPKLKASPLKPVIGLEIHAQVLAKSKLFSGAPSLFGGRVNSCVSHFDAAIPGTLPVINRRCVEAAVLTALALGCDISLTSSFDRKHYFYADMPAGYQITQHFNPVARNGRVKFLVMAEDGDEDPLEKTARIVQVQIEQDSGKSIHDELNGISLIDLNRAGQGLLEIVTAPDFEGSEDAVSFAAELKMILKSLGVCDGKMNEGNFRIDANVSLHRPGEPLGVRTEIKNLNSLKSARKAIDYEIQRQEALLARGSDVINETRGFDRVSGQTVTMRDKEIVTDYRFFPEPNLPPLRLSTSRRFIPGAVDVDSLAMQLPEFPEDIRQRLMGTYRLTRRQSVALVKKEDMPLFFEKVMDCLADMNPDFLSEPPKPRIPTPPKPQPCPPAVAIFWPFLHPSLCVSVTERVGEILLVYLVDVIEAQEKEIRTDHLSKFISRDSISPPPSDLTINDLWVTPKQVAALARLLHDQEVSPLVLPEILKALTDSREGSSIDVVKYIQEHHLKAIKDETQLLDFIKQAFLKEKKVLKELVKDNPKKFARAKMNIVGAALEASGLKADPIRLKELIDQEAENFRGQNQKEKK